MINKKKDGFVALVGAGPGHPGLLTLRGRDLLSRCDVVLYDGLSNTEMLVHASGAEHICVGKHGQSRIWKQTEIIDEMLAQAGQGRFVVRLKGGDPAVFARTSEEVEALIASDISFEIVPGITAALAAGSYAGIPITHRGIASAVALVTGHEQPDKAESDLDWAALAKFPGTLVIYMGVTTANQWTAALIDSGKDPATPCAILRRCSLPDQQRLHCRLDEVAGHLTPASKIRPPVITIVGPVTQLAESMDWFSRRPLAGRTILVTRPEDSNDSLTLSLQDLGANVLTQPAIKISPLSDFSLLDAAIDSLAQHDWVVFCSRNGVLHFLQRVLDRGMDWRVFAQVKIAAIGDATARALREFHLRADYVPPTFDADELTRHFRSVGDASSFLIVRASRGRDSIAEPLRQVGAVVDEIVAYQHTDVTEIDPTILASVRRGEVDWIIVTSSASVRSLDVLLRDAWSQAANQGCRVAAISPRTAAVARELGHAVHAVADPFTMDGLIEAIIASEGEAR